MMRVAISGQFFLDPEMWQPVERFIGQAPGAPVRAWSVGCHVGKEPYSLAMLASAAAKPEGYVLATDYDPEILEQARRGGPFSARDVSNLSAAQLAAHFEPGGPPYFVKSSLRNAVRFEQHDVRSQPPSQDFDLLLYRNVEPFFSAIENIEIYRRLSAAIRPGGLLFIGACERVALGHGLPFRQVGDSLYQRTE